jgi:hypothetical protein
MAALDMVMQYGGYVVGLFALGLIAYWWFDERTDTDDSQETVERVSERARVFTGGVVGSFGSLVIGIIAIFATIGNELIAALGPLGPLVMEFPALTGEVLLGLLALANLEGYIPLQTWQFGLMFIGFLLFTGFVIFADLGGARSRASS